MKKLIVTLVCVSMVLGSASALTVGGRDLGDFEIGLSTGFPLEWLKGESRGKGMTVSSELKPIHHGSEALTSVPFVMSFGSNFGWSKKLSNSNFAIGADLQSDILAGANKEQLILGGRFKLAPVFKYYFTEKFNIALLPGIILGLEEIDSKTAPQMVFYFPFGLGVGVKAQTYFTKTFGMNLGVDVDFMLKGVIEEQVKIIPNATAKLISVTPKLGFVFKF